MPTVCGCTLAYHLQTRGKGQQYPLWYVVACLYPWHQSACCEAVLGLRCAVSPAYNGFNEQPAAAKTAAAAAVGAGGS
jgi:hypothetical protein